MNRSPTSFLLMLLVSAILVLGAALAQAGLSRLDPPSPWPSVGLLLSVFWAGWLLSLLCRPPGDFLLLPLATLLCSVGWLEVYRLGPAISAPTLGERQAWWIALGILVFVLILFVPGDYRVLEDYKYSCLLIGVFLQLAVMLFGIEINGARLWFEIGPLLFQPVEVVKILLVVFLAAFLRQFRHWIRLGLLSPEGRLPRKALLLLGLGWACAEGVLVLQKDLGMALLLFGIFLSMFFLSTGRRDLVALSAVLAGLGSWACYHLFSHVRVRVGAWLNPFEDPHGQGYQMSQALYALASGGLDGSGLGMGRPFLVPEAYTDFIFVAVAEEWGMLGALGVLIVYMMLITRAFRISLWAGDEFGTLLAAGLATLLAWQTLILVGGTVQLAPMTGITLPFMSYGGSSMLANFLILGILWRISAVGEVSGGD
jgi:cell division protein FtsW (lipid II flippase)